ncbi:hypothetical protein I4F81_001459 [Pyropia yezoensis]|uniref:Uncharacterized protein n=1 Tax=Pyropia yezoensis TaxID=2788 RepID=A0ACC3BMQ2_PYRYE|nr:hypothetical protein I4F81_001459 [Neopyropia yezoensis]
MSTSDHRDDGSPPDSSLTPAAAVRAQKRQLRRSARTLQRERVKLSRTEVTQKLRSVLREYERESGRAALASEMMGEAVDDALAGEGEEEAADELVDSVMDELGLAVAGRMADAPTTQVGAVGTVEAEEQPVDAALTARMDQLRR